MQTAIYYGIKHFGDIACYVAENRLYTVLSSMLYSMGPGQEQLLRCSAPPPPPPSAAPARPRPVAAPATLINIGSYGRLTCDARLDKLGRTEDPQISTLSLLNPLYKHNDLGRAEHVFPDLKTLLCCFDVFGWINGLKHRSGLICISW